MRPTFCVRIVPALLSSESRTSLSPNNPITTGTNSRPPSSGVRPRVKRGVPIVGSVPIVPSSRPKAAISSARGSEPLDM